MNLLDKYNDRLRHLRDAGNEDAAQFLEHLFPLERVDEDTLTMSDDDLTAEAIEEQAHLQKCKAEVEAMTAKHGRRKLITRIEDFPWPEIVHGVGLLDNPCPGWEIGFALMNEGGRWYHASDFFETEEYELGVPEFILWRRKP